MFMQVPIEAFELSPKVVGTKATLTFCGLPKLRHDQRYYYYLTPSFSEV